MTALSSFRGERPTITTAHLAAAGGPELLSRDAWDIDARSYKGRDEFGAAVVSAASMVFTPAGSTLKTTRKPTG